MGMFIRHLSGFIHLGQTPIVICFVGPNGSGKSSITNALRISQLSADEARANGSIQYNPETGELKTLLVNADVIASSLLAANPETDVDAANLWAQGEAEKIRRRLAEKRLSFLFETVGSHPSKPEFLAELRASGYFVAVVFVGTEDPSINVKRVMARARFGGHDVPSEKVVGRYERCMGNLPAFYRAANLFVAFDNSADARPENPLTAHPIALKANGILTRFESSATWFERFLPRADA